MPSGSVTAKQTPTAVPGADVVADCGRVHAASVHLPLLASSDVVVAVLRPDVPGVVHTRDRLAALLAEYAAAVHDRTVGYLATLEPADLDRVVDENWDPPVTLGVRLVSIVNDDTQHVGQAAYVRGLLGV